MSDLQSILNQRKLLLERYPKTSNRSLQVVNNADLLLLKNLDQKDTKGVFLFNDRFGVLTCALHESSPNIIWNYASQKKAIQLNAKRTDLSIDHLKFYHSLDSLESVQLALIKIPKSVELFELYLQQIYQAASKDTVVICGFMTKYFNKSILKIASKYFKNVEQSLAWKKARLLTLTEPISQVEIGDPINTIDWKGNPLQQYYGVFSSGKVDIGTQFLLEDIPLKNADSEILDLASGNGVIAHEILKLKPNATLTLVDDSNLAIESSKLNISSNASFICDDGLSKLESNSFDLVVSNPPFHFEYENNIEVSIQLFKDVQRVLKMDGRFTIVANKHLNYTTHLRKMFKSVQQLRYNDKFEVLQCEK